MEFRGLVLDAFQVQAMETVDAGKSVIVAAPTGSGKTIVADYVISREFNSGRKVVYTAPVKALSNQKYRDFCTDYGKDNVGLLTGDVVINPEADILVMTTEVYRNMVVARDPVAAQVSHVVFDEIHYISDMERGTVWEEAIIFSPAHVRFVCLSATVPNAEEMGRWIARIKKHEVRVIRHEERPVPLKQWFFDAERGLCTLDALKDTVDVPDYRYVMGRSKRRRGFARNPSHEDLVDELDERELLPCIYFVFSRKDCERKAVELSRKKSFGNVAAPFDRLSPEIRALHSTTRLRQAVARGIAYHHAGMLPGVKHIVEELFAAGKIKVLYATETFAIGVNMPARTVVLDALRKFDGISVRGVTAREYAQMSGRAGRRGIDAEGNAVIMVFRSSFDLQTVQRTIGHDVTPVKSQFRLSVNTALNLLKRHSRDEIPDILTQTFWGYQQKKGKAVIARRFANLEKKLIREGYVKGSVLTPKGEFASRLYVDEMLLAELLSGGTQLDEYQLLLLFAALAYEPRKGEQFDKPRPDARSRQLERLLAGTARSEERLKSVHKLTAVIRPCWEGRKFGSLLRTSNLPEGDLAKLLTQMMDRLRQVKKASPEKSQREKVERCMDALEQCLSGIDIL